MSIKLMSAAWAVKTNHTDKLVLMALADGANDDGVCWPSVSTIAEKSCLSVRGVQAAVARLNNAGILRKVMSNGHSNTYLITILGTMISDKRAQQIREDIVNDYKKRKRRPPQTVHPTPANCAPHPRTVCTPTPAGYAPPPPHAVHP